MALIEEVSEGSTSSEATDTATGGATGGATSGNTTSTTAAEFLTPEIPPTPPQKPPASAPKVNTITEGDMVQESRSIGKGLTKRKKNSTSITYRINVLEGTISKIQRNMAINEDPRSHLVGNLIKQAETEVMDIQAEFRHFSNTNIEILTAVETIRESLNDGGIDYSVDLKYIEDNANFKRQETEIKIASSMRNLDMVKSIVDQ